MAKYIEYDVALQFVYDACTECMESCEEFDGIYPDCHQCLLGGVKLKLRHTPAADVRPVVLCRECKHRDPEDRKCDCGQLERAGCVFPVDDDYFCAHGEKREES